MAFVSVDYELVWLATCKDGLDGLLSRHYAVCLFRLPIGRVRYALKMADTMNSLRRLAIRDQLTGLLNRRMFEQILQEEL